MIKEKPLSIISKVLLPLLLLCACADVPTVKEPVYNRNFDEVVADLSRSGDFKTVALRYVANQTNDHPVENKIEIRLSEGSNLPLTESGLDSMAKAKAAILKRSVQNIHEYQWVYVMFERTEEENPDKAWETFLYSPKELQ